MVRLDAGWGACILRGELFLFGENNPDFMGFLGKCGILPDNSI
jgi:hypothetical protein